MNRHPRPHQHALLLSLALLACASDEPSPDEQAAAIECTTPQIVGRVPAELQEASGVAPSRRVPGLWWTINDDVPAELFAIDSTGTIRGRLRIDGAEHVDWESLTSSTCDSGHCLYIADIGDNIRIRPAVSVYRVAEPTPDEKAVTAQRFDFRYPDGPHDAEAIFVLPGEQLYVFTKGRSEPLTLYRYPGALRSGVTPTLEVVQKLSESFVQLPEMITGAGSTPNGEWIVVRTYSRLQLFRLEQGRLVPQLADSGVDLTALNEFQGEGVDIRADGSILLLSEKGLDQGSAPISRLSCRVRS